MGWLRRLLSIGRLRRDAPLRTAGRVLPPASVQRTQLGLKEVDPSRGVVTLRSGEVRAFLKVTGFPAHLRSTAECRAWLQGYARVLNTLPGSAVMIVRGRAGGLEGHLGRQRAQAAALAEREPGSALARLAADQLAHARRLQETGRVRRTDQFVALHSPRGDVARLLAAARACREHLATAGVRAELVTDRELGEALAAGWHPERGGWEFWRQDWAAADGEVVAVLSYAPRHARVTEPRYVDPGREPAPSRATVRETPTDGKLPGGGGRPRPP
jgi:hypothetical protein